MSDDPLDHGVKRYYKQQTLSSEVLSRLEMMGNNTDAATTQSPVVNTPNHSFLSIKRMALAASIFLSLMMGLQFGGLYWGDQRDILSRVAQEVALNHHKQLASDYVSSSYSQLAVDMDKLDFTLQAPNVLQALGYQLVGARYCSIQGNIAAQLRLKNVQGQSMTLYVTQLSESLKVLQNKSQQYDALTIQNWYEGELFFSLASAIEMP